VYITSSKKVSKMVTDTYQLMQVAYGDEHELLNHYAILNRDEYLLKVMGIQGTLNH